jgi:hypothetical protein
VRQSRALLDDYVGLKSQTHHTKQLLLNPKWTGMNDVGYSFNLDSSRVP